MFNKLKILTMKKNFKFMLVALMAFFGYNGAFAQLPAEITKGSFVYENVTVTDASKKEATATIKEVAAGKSAVTSDKKIALVGNFDYVVGDDTWKVKVIGFQAIATKNNPEATSVVIPKEFKAIPAEAFYGCSSLASITFEAESEVSTIGTHAFATTQITDFDFSPCKKLAGLPNEVFVEPGLNNTFITKVTVPTEPLFKHINGAFKNLTNLTEIGGLGSSWIQEIIAEAFDGCESLKKINLPGNALKYIDGKALKGSVIEELGINVNSLLYLGGGTVNPATYEFTAAAQTWNLYDIFDVNLTPLKKLTLTGLLQGHICKNAFAYCDKLSGILDLSPMSFGSTGQIETEAFYWCYDNPSTDVYVGIEGVKIGNITDNVSTTDYTIAAGAFKKCDILTSVEIGNITTANAIGAKAFNDKLKNVKIGTVRANGAAFAVQAFVWADVSGATLELAQGTGEYLNANDIHVTLIQANTFDMSAIVTGGTGWDWPTIKIGEIKSKGGVFAADAIALPTKIDQLIYTGAIAANGLDKQFTTTPYAGLTAITFKGAIGEAGIAGGVFANVSTITTLNFEGLLAEGAVAGGAFAITDDTSSKYAVNYTCSTVPDYTVNPFAKNALNGTSTSASTRFIALTVSNTDLLNNFKDAVNGLGTDNQFDVYLALIAEETPTTPNTFLVYRNSNEKKMAWGRYDLGLFAKEQGPENAYYGMVSNGMLINRIQNGMKITIYGIYTDEDEIGEESTVYMVPLQVFDGQYQIKWNNPTLFIIKAEKMEGEFDKQDIEVAYSDETATENSRWAGLKTAPSLEKADDTYTNQQLWDGTGFLGNTIWEKLDGTYVADEDKKDDQVQKALYVMTDPSKYNGFRIDKNTIKKGSGGKGAYIKKDWWYALLHDFKPAAAARIVWLDEDQATAIYGVKEVKSVENEAIYNLAGQKVSASYKGFVIKNGKKYIQK
jgi:hypothetical protein